MQSLPLFHRIAGQPVIVLGSGDAATAKRRLVERAGGQVVDDIAKGIDQGARLAFVAHDDAGACAADALRLRGAGLLVNVVDQPDLCDFTTPSLLDRDPVLIAIGTGGASAGLAKVLRLRLEQMLPAKLGALASGLQAARARMRARWPRPDARRRALDQALEAGGMLDLLDEDAATRLESWLANESPADEPRHITIILTSPDPDDLTLRQARLLGSADIIRHDPGVPQTILARARADAVRVPRGPDAAGMPLLGLTVELLLP